MLFHRLARGLNGIPGYSCQPIKDAIAAQLDALPYYSIFRGTSNDKVIELAEELRDFFAPAAGSAGDILFRVISSELLS